jgi:hypothetical protein
VAPARTYICMFVCLYVCMYVLLRHLWTVYTNLSLANCTTPCYIYG